MTEMLRCRVERDLLQQVNEISRHLGTSTSELVRIFLNQVAKRRGLPFPLVADDNSDILPPASVRAKIIEDFYGDEPAYR